MPNIGQFLLEIGPADRFPGNTISNRRILYRLTPFLSTSQINVRNASLYRSFDNSCRKWSEVVISRSSRPGRL